MHVLFLLDVVVCCCIIYNMLLDGKDFDVDTLLIELKLESFVNITHGHGQKRRGQEETTTKNSIDTKVDIELQDVEMSW